MSSAKGATSSSDSGRGYDNPIQIATFPLFSKLAKEVQDMIWDEVVKSQGQRSIYFFQIYSCKTRQGRETSKRVRLDKNSTAAYLARIKPTCKGLMRAIERNFQLAIANGEQFQPVTVSIQSGETQAQVNVNDIVFFGTLDDGWSFTNGNLPTDRRTMAHPASFFKPFYRATFRAPAQWSWIRRIALSFPMRNRPIEAFALAGCSTHFRYSSPDCYHCFAWNLTGFRGLEEVIYIMKGLPKPSEANPYRLLTKISAELHDDSVAGRLLPRCEHFHPEIPDGRGEGVNTEEHETDDTLQAINGSDREYYQVRLSFIGRTSSAHHSLRHFARAFYYMDMQREAIYDETPRAHDVLFKLMSYEDLE